MKNYERTAWVTLPGTQALLTIRELQMDILRAERALLVPSIAAAQRDAELKAVAAAWREIRGKLAEVRISAEERGRAGTLGKVYRSLGSLATRARGVYPVGRGTRSDRG